MRWCSPGRDSPAEVVLQRVEQAAEGIKQIATNPKDWHGYVNTVVGTASGVLGGHALAKEVQTASKAVTAAAKVERFKPQYGK